MIHTEHFDIHKLVLLITIASTVAVAVKKIRLPYTIALVIAGFLLSFFHVLEPIELTEELVLYTILPALLFEAAWNLDVRHLRKTAGAILLMATVGVALAIGLIGWLIHVTLGLPLLTSLLFGAIVAPTDPVSVVAIMKQMRLDHRLSALIEGESLCNDGTAVVFFKVILALILMGSAFDVDSAGGLLASGAVQFLMVVCGGAIIGGLVGLCFSIITSKFDDHLLELTFTTITAYGSFLLAEMVLTPGSIHGLHLSGVIATVSSGLVFGNYGRQHGMSSSTRIVVTSFWEYAAFFANSLIFLLIGLEIAIVQFLQHGQAILWTLVIVFVGRAVSVYLMSFLANISTQPKIPGSWQHVLVWGGLKGALSMALVLSLSREVVSEEVRELLIIMVFSVVLFSLLVQGLSMSRVLRKLGLGTEIPEALFQYRRLKAELITGKKALSGLREWTKSGEVTAQQSKQLEEELSHEIDALENKLDELHISNQLVEIEESVETQAQILELRKDLVQQMVVRGALPESIASELVAEYDSRLEHVQEGILAEHLQDGHDAP